MGSPRAIVAWHSSDENVAIVRDGLVRGVSGGQTQIVAIWGGYQAHAVLSVIASGKKHDNPPSAWAHLARRAAAGDAVLILPPLTTRRYRPC